MSAWKAKRFWKEATIEQTEEGFGILLDARPVKTPAKRRLVVPTQGFALKIASEWDAQEGQINPLSMPFTQSANAAVDKVAVQHAEVADMLAAYGDSDLLCYRANRPDALIARQAAQWDPILDWAAKALDARLIARTGVMHVPQDPEALAKLRAHVHAMSPYQLTGFHDLVSLSGSLILGFAAAQHLECPNVIWDISRLDEIWQAQEWGKDDDAEAAATVKGNAFLHAKQVFDLATA